MPANTPREDNPQTSFLNAARESQAALLDAVDRAFDLAEQTLAAQRQLARTLVGVADRQVDTIVETVESSARETLQQAEELLETDVVQPAPAERSAASRAQAQKTDAKRTESEKPRARKQNGKRASKVDRRPFEERSIEELRERAGELDVEGRSNMSKDELVAALRQQAR